MFNTFENKTQIVAIVTIVAFIFFLSYQIFSKDKVKNINSAGTDIVALGDSLVYGYGASDPSKNFVSILSRKISRPIINLGVSGNTTSDVLNRINELDTYHPKVVILLVGGNDYLRKVPQEQTFNNLRAIIKNIQNRGSAVLLLGIRGGVLRDNFESDFSNVSDELQTAYVPDVLSGLITNNRYMFDAVHPNDLGYESIANKVYPKLKTFIK